MSIVRITESSSAGKDTHTHRGYKKAFKYCRDKMIHDSDHRVLDLFARNCPWGDFRNDLNPEFKGHNTNITMDALECAMVFDSRSIDIILFDPPFSSRQDVDKYGGDFDASLWTNPKYISDLGDAMYRILATEGYIIKAGYNSNPPHPDLKLIKIYLSHFGACRNDVIVSIWQKVNTDLFAYCDF